MSQICQVTGKRPLAGNTVSHANNKKRRRFELNIRYKRFWSPERSRWITLRLTTAGQRIIDKHGIDVVLADLVKSGEKF